MAAAQSLSPTETNTGTPLALHLRLPLVEVASNEDEG